MTYDIILTTGHGAAYLPACIAALAKVDFALSELNLVVPDIAFQDGTLAELSALQKTYACFGGFEVLPLPAGTGLPAAQNAAAGLGSAPFLFFLDSDAAVAPGLFSALQAAIAAAPLQAAAFECRTLPCEASHHIDPVTLSADVVSSSALVVRRAAFEAVGGFDKHPTLFYTDTDLSWRLRAAGHTLQAVPAATVTFFSLPATVPEDTLENYAGGLLGQLLLRCKYGSLRAIWRGKYAYLRALRHPAHYPGVRRSLVRLFLRHFALFWSYFFWRFRHRPLFRAAPTCLESPLGPQRGTFAFTPTGETPLVSVLVRTCGRPDTLRQTLLSLTQQTYRHFEVIVVEDGPPASEEMVQAEFSALPLRYTATGQPLGRAKAGNLALSQARGVYCNFLDDDDYFYPDHLELLTAVATAHPQADLVTAASMAMEADVLSRTPYRLAVKDIHPMLFDRMDNFLLCQTCLMPIQSVLFKRRLFTEHGGLNEALDGNEDWSMWLKYFSVATRIHDDMVDVPRATSVFLVPADPAAERARRRAYRRYEAQMLDDESIRFSLSPRQMREYYRGVLADIRHLQRLGKLDEFLQRSAEEEAEETALAAQDANIKEEG